MSNVVHMESGVRMSDVSEVIGAAALAASEDLYEKMEDLEAAPDDPTALINVQMAMGIWSSVTSTASSLYAGIKDMMTTIAQKV